MTVPAARDAAPATSAGDRVVNGEAVEVDVRVARLGSRALALLLDIAVQALLILLLTVGALALLPVIFRGLADEAFAETTLIVLTITVFIVYPTTVETLTNGRSLGKRALGLRVVREDGGPIRVRHALTRTLVGVAVEWPGLIMPLVTWVVSMSAMVSSPRGRRLGDLAAGTFVVHERSSSDWGWMPAMPPALAGWAQTLDLSGVDDDLALATRHYLARSRTIRQPHHGRFAVSLAAEMAARIPQPPLPGTPPWLFLAAVLAERRRRAGRQAYTTRELTDRIWPGFGRLDRFTSRAVPSHPVGGGDAEQVQAGPQGTGGQLTQA